MGAAHHVGLVNDHQLEVRKALVALLPAPRSKQGLLAGDDHLACPPLVGLGLELGHLNVRIRASNLTDLVDRLPDKLTLGADDQRASFDPISERAEDDGLPGAGEQTVQHGPLPLAHGRQVLLNDRLLVITQREHGCP